MHFSKSLLCAALCAMIGAATARAAMITSTGTGSFSNDSILMLPTGGYAVDFDSTSGLTTTGSSAGATTPVVFEGGPPSTSAGTNTSSTPAASGIGGNSDLTLTVVSGTGSSKIGASGSYLGTGTIPTLATAKLGNGIPDSNFATIVGTGDYVSGASTDLEVTLNNLNIGDNYNLQLLLVDGRSSGGVATSGATASIYQDSANANLIATVPIDYPTGGTSGVDIGGYIDASFTADATSQNFYLEVYKASGANSGGNIQALVLQDASAIPEPASLSLLAASAITLLTRRARNA